MKNSKGISTVIITLFSIAMAFVAVSVVWIAISNLINVQSERISIETQTVNLEVESVKVEGNGDVSVKVKRGKGDGDLTGVSFLFSDGANSKTVEMKDVNLEQLEEKTFIIQENEISGISSVKKVSVAPIVKGNGKDVQKNIVDEQKTITEEPRELIILD